MEKVPQFQVILHTDLNRILVMSQRKFHLIQLYFDFHSRTRMEMSKYSQKGPLSANGNDNEHASVEITSSWDFIFRLIEELRRLHYGGCEWDGSLTDFSGNANPVGNNWSNFYACSLYWRVYCPFLFLSTATPCKKFSLSLIYRSLIFYVPIILHSCQNFIAILASEKLI